MANQNLVFQGLGTLSHVVSEAGSYYVDGHISLPTLSNGGGVSACLVNINKNGGAPFYTGQAGAEGFYAKNVSLAVGDTLNFVFSSAAAADQGFNVIKAQVDLGTGA